MSWGEICRLCLRQGLKTYNIYSDSSQDSAVTMTIRIKWVAELEVCEGDGLPNQVCQPCVQKLNAGYEFKRQCLISDKTLRKFMSQTNNNNLSPEASANTSESSQEATCTPSKSKQSDSELDSPELVEVKEEVIAGCDSKEPSVIPIDDAEDAMNVGSKVETVYRESSNDSDSALDLSLSEGVNSSEGSEVPSDGQPMVLIPGVPSKANAADKKKPVVLQCEFCDKKFVRKKSLETHMKLHGSPNPSGKKDFKCNVCGQAFHCPSLYHRHLRVHTGKKLYVCQTCNQSFSTQGSLTVHKKSHTGQKDYKCHVCSKAFTVQGSLNVHLRTHTQEKPYACTECPKSFSVQRDLMRHSKCHTGEKNYKCGECGKSFSRRDSLTSHVRIHQGIKPYRCLMCKRSYPTQSNLTKHVKKHHGGAILYKCDECPKEFSEEVQLKEHAKLHEVDNVYKCPSCDKTFTKQTSLSKHFLTHKEEYEFKCGVCSRSFPQQINLTRHQRCHVDEKR